MRVLLLNQCFYPDVMATAQQLTSLARGLSERGHEVTVLASDRGYDNPETRFPRRERWQGIEIIRLGSLALGKSSKWRRAVNFSSFLLLCSIKLLFLPRFDAVVALTSPPLISFLGAWFVRLKGGRFFFWVMDLNPDEAIAAGWLKEGSTTANSLEGLLRYSLRHAARVIVLDRFMKMRIEAKGIDPGRIETISPWALDDAVVYNKEGREAFRARHRLTEKFVVMYAGNHSPCHPLDTVLAAAAAMSDETEVAFCFVGGGSEQSKVREFAESRKLANILTLPYQPLAELAASLSAADLHLVVMGEQFGGIIHPCKIYNILRVGAPFLYVGPLESSSSDVMAQLPDGYPAFHARHGETATVVELIRAARARSGSDVRAVPSVSIFSEAELLPRLIGVLEENVLDTAGKSTDLIVHPT
jgi:glycosyltransferase involved in cell wall biosynthesis